MLLAWSDQATTGTFVIVGVVIGATIGGLVQAHFESRRDRGEVRQARRMIADEVLRIALDLDAIVAKRHTARHAGVAATSFPSDAWSQYGPGLARHWKNSRDDDFETLSAFMGSVPLLREIAQSQDPSLEASPDLLDRAKEGAEIARDTYKMLTGKPLRDDLTGDEA